MLTIIATYKKPTQANCCIAENMDNPTIFRHLQSQKKAALFCFYQCVLVWLEPEIPG